MIGIGTGVLTAMGLRGLLNAGGFGLPADAMVLEPATVAGHVIRATPTSAGNLTLVSVRDGEVVTVEVAAHAADPRYADVLEKLGVDTSVVGGGGCGLAGNWGCEPGHYEISQTLGERNLFPAIRAAEPGAIVLADGFSCRTQIAQGTQADAVHLAEVMCAALPTKRRTLSP